MNVCDIIFMTLLQVHGNGQIVESQFSVLSHDYTHTHNQYVVCEGFKKKHCVRIPDSEVLDIGWSQRQCTAYIVYGADTISKDGFQ